MLPALMEAKPLIKYGVLIGLPVLILTISHTTVYFKGKAACAREQDALIAEASMQAMKESVKADAMEAKVVKANDQAERVIEAKAELIKKEVVHHARKNPKPLAAATIAIYDRLVSLPNEAGRSVSSANPGAGASEVPRGGMEIETVTRIQDEEGNQIELTTEELAQAATDFSKLYAKMKNKYGGFSDWNDGRERLELERLNHEAE
jgi:hypothetical protein